MTNDKDSAVLEVTTIVGHAKQLLDYASADCSECGGSGASFGHGLAVEVEHIVDRLADLALRQPTQTDALRMAREALEAAPLIGATESAESFKARQDAWLNGQYRAALDQSK